MQAKNDPFAGLENLDDLKPSDRSGSKPRKGFTNIELGSRKQIFTDRCDKCRGSGRFVGYSGRDFGPCFKCKGKGTIDYKSSPSERATRKQQAVDRKEKQKKKISDQAVAWQAAHPAVTEWINSNIGKGSFAMSLMDNLSKFGSLTDGQIAAVEKAIARDADRKAQAQARVDNAKSIDVSKIEQAFAKARENAKALGALGIRWLTLRLDTFKFLDAPARGEWKAAILVRKGDTKLGRISEGKFVRSFACDDPTEARIIAVAANPAAAAIAYGKKFGACAICGRELTNDGSIERGIGPICAEKFGF